MGAEIKYNGTVIANIEDGQTVTLKCQGNMMKSDVVIVAKMPTFTISGVWVLNATVDFSMFTDEFVEEVNGRTDGIYSHEYIFDKLKITPADRNVSGYIPASPYRKYQSFYFSEKWQWSITHFDFGEEEQEVSGEFYNWLTTNATKQ